MAAFVPEAALTPVHFFKWTKVLLYRGFATRAVTRGSSRDRPLGRVLNGQARGKGGEERAQEEKELLERGWPGRGADRVTVFLGPL